MVKYSMRFDGIVDFYERKERIRHSYLSLTTREKYEYKYYVYSRRILKDKSCDAIWEYLNYIEPQEMISPVIELRKEYVKYTK